MRRWRRAAVMMAATTALAGCGVPGPPANGVGGSSSGGAPAGSATVTQGTPSAGAGGAVRSLPRLVEAAEWVRRDGVRALKVTPSTVLRDASDSAVFDEAWRRVVVAVPAADTPGLKDQFVCHATFASAKDAWYLEPARPDVGYWETVKARCNPGDVRDVG